LEQNFIRLLSRAYRVIRQHELPEVGFVEGCRRLDLRFFKSQWFRIGVRIKNRRRRRGVAGPKTETAHLLRVCLSRYCIGEMRDPGGMRRSCPSGKPRQSKVEAAPEKMYRAAFATKARSELLEHAIALHQNPPESIGVFPIVRPVLFIFIERNRVLNLVRYHVDLDR